MRSDKKFSIEAIEKLRAEIEEAGGNEVFALGFLDHNKIVSRIEVKARGNEESVIVFDELAGADVLIHNHPSGFLSPSDEDLTVSARAAAEGIGSYIVDNRIENVYVVAEPINRQRHKKLDPLKICSALEPGGDISTRLESYEVRENQLNLMRLVIKGFNEDAIIAAEAGTGIGKSFAYLVPSVNYAAANDERIIISTATINLQEQLFGKDIPLVIKGLNKKIKTVLVKGRGNYLCRRRLLEALREPFLDSDEMQQLKDIVQWAENTKTGCRSDISFLPSESVWSQVCSEADTCMGMRCHERENCFVMLLRKDALDARLIVVNHHLLFADLAARQGGAGYTGQVVLPPYSRVIIDEAHTMEESASSFFSQECSRLSIYRQLNRLYRKRHAKKNGLLARLLSYFPVNKKGSPQDNFEDRITEIFNKIREAAASLDQNALEICGGEGVFRLTIQKDSIIKDKLTPLFFQLRKNLNSLLSLVREKLDNLPKENYDDPLMWELRPALRRLDAICSVCTSFIEYSENPDNVIWIERRFPSNKGDSSWAVFNVTPLSVAPYLKESLFYPNKTVICVSATLTTGNSFQYWKSRSGLDYLEKRELFTGIYPSPFPYHSRVLLAAPDNAPLPTESGYGIFVDMAAAALAEISSGSALVLFTSYAALKSAYDAALPALEKNGIKVFKQGDDDRKRLMESFLKDSSSCLFATDSFWEGIDAPGDTLRLVVLCRLPFRSPGDPVFEARCEAVENGGGSAFMDLSLPEAVMKFKQGFGRLMRRSSDHGAVVVLDGRLLRKQYGKFFLNSLPETKTCFGDLETILGSLERFLFP